MNETNKLKIQALQHQLEQKSEQEQEEIKQ